MPASLLEACTGWLVGRLALVLVCYLDDSGKDPQNSLTTIAGYVARDTAWAAVEAAVEPIFVEKKVDILHTKDLHSSRGVFKGWRVLEKQAFVARICRAMAPHVMLGVSMSAVKQNYKEASDQSNRKRTVTPYTFCFNVIMDWLLRDIRTGKAVNEEGLALILEAGHENNPEAEQQFHIIREMH